MECPLRWINTAVSIIFIVDVQSNTRECCPAYVSFLISKIAEKTTLYALLTISQSTSVKANGYCQENLLKFECESQRHPYKMLIMSQSIQLPLFNIPRWSNYLEYQEIFRENIISIVDPDKLDYNFCHEVTWPLSRMCAIRLRSYIVPQFNCVLLKFQDRLDRPNINTKGIVFPDLKKVFIKGLLLM